MYCEKCGQEIPDHATFCGKCGNRVETTSSVQNFRNHKKSKRSVFGKLMVCGGVIVVLFILGIRFGLRIDEKQNVKQLILCQDLVQIKMRSSAS